MNKKTIIWIVLGAIILIALILLFLPKTQDKKNSNIQENINEADWLANLNNLEKTNLEEYYNSIYQRCISYKTAADCDFLLNSLENGGYRLNPGTGCSGEYIEARYPRIGFSPDIGYGFCKPFPESIKLSANKTLNDYYGKLVNKLSFYDVWPGNDSYHLRYSFNPEESLSIEVDFSLDSNGNIKEDTQNTLVNCQAADTFCPPFNLTQNELEEKFNKLSFVSCSVPGFSLARISNPEYNGYGLAKRYNCKDNCTMPSATKGYDPECKIANINPFIGAVIE